MTVDLGQLIALIAGISTLVVAIGKHIMPILMAWMGFKDRETKTAEKVLLLETNHIAHLSEDIREIKKDLKELSRIIIQQGKEITELQAIVFKKK